MVIFQAFEDKISWLIVGMDGNLSDLAIISTKSRGAVDNDTGFRWTKSLL